MTDIKPLNKQIEIIPRNLIRDKRGWFLKTLTGIENGISKELGEIYAVFSENGASRGGHYHKKAKEWFILLNGLSRLELKDVRTNETMIIILDSENPKTVVVPPFVAHRFDAINSSPFLLLAYTDIKYNPQDTFSYIFLNE